MYSDCGFLKSKDVLRLTLVWLYFSVTSRSDRSSSDISDSYLSRILLKKDCES